MSWQCKRDFEGILHMNGACSLHEPTIESLPHPDAALVVLRGEHDLNSADELRRTFDQSLAHWDHLIVDLSAAEFIDARIIMCSWRRGNTPLNLIEVQRRAGH